MLIIKEHKMNLLLCTLTVYDKIIEIAKQVMTFTQTLLTQIYVIYIIKGRLPISSQVIFWPS